MDDFTFMYADYIYGPVYVHACIHTTDGINTTIILTKCFSVRYRCTFNMGLEGYIYLSTNLLIDKQKIKSCMVVYTERQILHDVSAR